MYMRNIDNYSDILKYYRTFKQEARALHAILYDEDGTFTKEDLNKIRQKMRSHFKDFIKALLVLRHVFFLRDKLKKEITQLDAARKKCYSDLERYQQAKMKQIGEAYFSPEDEKQVAQALRRKQAGLVVKQKEVDKLEQELIVKQEELETRIQDTNLAKSSYYHLTDEEFRLFTKDREKILKGVEKYGSISLAVQKDATIKSRVSSIIHHANKHKQFGEDLEIAKQVFKDSLDAEILERAINGTVNPVFQKGEYIGDYAVKDNKLLVEVAKAKLAETYNPRAHAAANPQGSGGTTINILSFDGVDETKHGYAKNIGVVKSVDDSGRVERITQSKKMLDFYKNKGTAEIIKAEYERVEEEDK